MYNASHQRLGCKRIAATWSDCMRLLGGEPAFNKLYSRVDKAIYPMAADPMVLKLEVAPLACQ
jgi:hypothetical protein